MKLRRMPFWVMVAGAMSLLSQPALAWDPATTHAGLTERALAGSNFHATPINLAGRWAALNPCTSTWARWRRILGAA